MAVHNFHIATFDKPNFGNMLTHDEGDIVNVRPQGSEIGRKVLDYYLIIPVSISIEILSENLMSRLHTPLYEDGSIEGKDWRNIFDEDNIDPSSYPNNQYVIDTKTSLPRLRPEKVAKLRYQIALSDLGDVSLTLAGDPHIIYQPFLTEDRLINLNCFIHPDSEYQLIQHGSTYYSKHTHTFKRKIYQEEINGRTIHFIRPKEPAMRIELDEPEKEIFCSTASISKNEEKIWGMLNFLRDKFDDSFLTTGDLQ